MAMHRSQRRWYESMIALKVLDSSKWDHDILCLHEEEWNLIRKSTSVKQFVPSIKAYLCHPKNSYACWTHVSPLCMTIKKQCYSSILAFSIPYQGDVCLQDRPISKPPNAVHTILQRICDKHLNAIRRREEVASSDAPYQPLWIIE